MAHPNAILNDDETLLIFKHVTATLKFVEALEVRTRADAPEDGDGGAPF